MKLSIFVTGTSAALAMAGPINFLKKRILTTEVVTEYYTMTVWADASSTTSTTSTTSTSSTTSTTSMTMSGKSFWINGGDKDHSRTTTSVEPSTSSDTVIVVASTVQHTTSEAPVVAATTTIEAPVVAAEPTSSSSPSTKIAAEVASSTASTQAAVASPSDMASQSLYSHNLHRANHSAPEMSWSEEIAGYAQTTANKCVFAHDMDEGEKGYGQNIAMWATSSGAAALGDRGAMSMATTDFWYNGEFQSYLPSYYGVDTPDMTGFEKWGHFSQVLWVDSNLLGCYAKLCTKGTMYTDMDAWFMVCNYRPAGNVGGGYGKNVLEPLGEPSATA